MFYISKIFFSLGLLMMFVCAAAAQDLGSSNSLFHSPNPAAKKSSAKTAPPAAKKTPPRKTSTASVKTTDRPKAKKAVSRTEKNGAAAGNIKLNQVKTVNAAQNNNVTQAQTEPPRNTIITVGQPGGADFDESYEKAIDEGNAARDERDYEKAEKSYLRAQTLKPGDSRAIYGLGNLFSDQQRWDEAERAYRAAVQLDPAAPDAYNALSFVLTQPISGANLGDRYAEAEKNARTAINLDAGSAMAYDQLGVALELRGLISAETEKAYRQAIALDADFALAYAHLGRLLRRKGDVAGSAAAYRSANQLSNDVPTMILVADVMQSQQRYFESEQLLRRALRTDPKNPTALYLLGRALTTRGSYDEAETVLKKSAEISPNSFVSYILLGSMYSRQGKLDSAESSLNKALKLVSPNEKKRLAQEFETVGDGYARAGKDKDAARAYRQAQQLDADKSGLSAKLAKVEGS